MKVTLPSNLDTLLTSLSDEELATLLAAVESESRRRAPPRIQPPMPQSAELAAGKVSMILASARAGLSLAKIAKMTGLSRAAIAQVLRSQTK